MNSDVTASMTRRKKTYIVYTGVHSHSKFIIIITMSDDDDDNDVVMVLVLGTDNTILIIKPLLQKWWLYATVMSI